MKNKILTMAAITLIVSATANAGFLSKLQKQSKSGNADSACGAVLCLSHPNGVNEPECKKYLDPLRKIRPTGKHWYKKMFKGRLSYLEQCPKESRDGTNLKSLPFMNL
ncbi:TrbM/KikA/MpfK family conjugal transfer protein [Aggregatibacter actinomycetemcomitans]|uniref:TrbM/KikA/MpfK family conjugal transfer protein n=1 Tax=Aggregatibacter actinomycetemcomitans TaxID=714 RepID=UPI00077E8A64|nr:TrbM/KikA/MpfK family conjugal transfer protein [Aggregatibacter actinomycetemcomitans]KYK75348.1 hypothetical protein SA3096_03240 [Aggregatibacter actinomycetemcomitans serotype e str. SA3096]KYK77518.1 hypothetical protein SC936_10860 [Aggregatibacter actinomycetemcomitans serotype e str. SC936]MBN6059361.1 hypothetical protein [Aggregatibacter actinomycetemcomitans]MBN6078461.1 hypothetical protein [Aggregatibacter actinomycetemcomitans]MBN6078467.1 hypothetical protein [Aggregatibacter